MSSKKLLFALVAISISSLLTAGNTSPVNHQLFQEIDSLVSEGEAKKALKILSLKIEDSPSDTQLRTKRANLFLYMERTDEAKAELDNVLSESPDYVPAMLEMGRLMVYNNSLDSAFLLLNSALEKSPDFETQEGIYGLIGKIHMEKEEYGKAEVALFRAVRTPQVSLNTMRDLADVLNKNGKQGEAALVLKETLDIFGHHIESYVNTGFISNQIGFYDEAIHYLEAALKLEPQNPYALANIAESYLRTGYTDKALTYVNQSLSQDNSNSYAFKVKGECLLQAGKNEKACEEFTKSIQMGYSVIYEPTEIIQLVIEACGFED